MKNFAQFIAAVFLRLLVAPVHSHLDAYWALNEFDNHFAHVANTISSLAARVQLRYKSLTL